MRRRMGEAIGHAIPFGAAVALSPFPIVAMVLILATPRRHVTGPAMALGSLCGLLVVGGALLLLAHAVDLRDDGDPATWVSVLMLVLAAGLLALAVQQWRARPARGETPEEPGWMASLGTLTPLRAAGLGWLLSALNPKNLVLIAAGAAAIAEAGGGRAAQAAGLAVFVALAMLGVTIPRARSLLLGDRAAAPLERLRDWMARESATVVAVILVLFAAKLSGDAIGALT